MAGKGAEEEDDYMGDLSLFLPPDLSSSSSSSSSTRKLGSKERLLPQQAKPKRPRGLSWQEQRRLERERRQREEDERTVAGLDAAIPETNVGFKLLRRMGFSPGSALGKDGAGRAEPVALEIRRSRAGIGAASPAEEAARRGREAAERTRRMEEEMAAEFGSRQRRQWRTRRVVADYRKADAALAQLENREIVEEPLPTEDADANMKAEGTAVAAAEEEEEEEKEEEEVITEEDLHELLTKLRDEHRYCLYCGCQYESAEALATNCPGVNEDDH
ncbi:G patch domain-containing protein 11 isoform X2 [Ananas comosus]|uniref:G patch domain-containing protein 11 n=1 Tax=Ananas comosus TaxID=4615 RepID=A0A199UEV8_ANACO|nr:G patch domain-containing protein 11 isoform X2 [Ananas comosus]OAY63269.1 G patch domain-containing protein 11 [Ananas comosus]